MEFRSNSVRRQQQVEWYVAYTRENPAEESFLQFRNIVDMYILAGSKLEINIDTAMRNKILEVGMVEAYGHRYYCVVPPRLH